MIQSRLIIILGHVVFWLLCIDIQIYTSAHHWFVDIISVLAYTFAFYINYFIVMPLMPSKKPQQALLLSLSLYLILSVSQIYPLYELLGTYFVPLQIVQGGHEVGAILHVSFFFYALSSLSRIMIDKLFKNHRKYKSSINKVNKNITEIRNKMSFNFTSDILTNLYDEAVKNPESTAKPIGKLSRVLRYKLHKENAESTLLSDEIKIIKQYLELVALINKGQWEIITRDEAWIPVGSALKKVEEFIQTTTQKSGILMISADDDEVWVTVK